MLILLTQINLSRVRNSNDRTERRERDAGRAHGRYRRRARVQQRNDDGSADAAVDGPGGIAFEDHHVPKTSRIVEIQAPSEETGEDIAQVCIRLWGDMRGCKKGMELWGCVREEDRLGGG